MVNAKTRKAVYIPYELWAKLDAEAKPSFDSVTTTLKNIILAHINKDNKKPIAQEITTAIVKEVEEDDVF